MRILDMKKSLDEVASVVTQKARYQKVVVCIDEQSDMEYIDRLCGMINQNVVLMKYYYNASNISAFFNLVNNGVRVVIYHVSLEHFYQLQTNNNYLLNVFIPQSTFILPYVTNVESMYGDNVLVCDTGKKDYASLCFLYEMALTNLWNRLLRGDDINTSMFKNIDAIANGKVDFNYETVNQLNCFKSCLDYSFTQLKEQELPYYIYLRICATLKMLENVNKQEEEYIDFYKTELSMESVSKAYALIVKYDIINTVRINSDNLIKICIAILNRLKIIIKKYFYFKNIKLNKINKIIKNDAKVLNIDNLLYISYIFNAI